MYLEQQSLFLLYFIDVAARLNASRLRFIPSKTRAMWLGHAQQSLLSSQVKVESSRNIGVVLYIYLPRLAHVATVLVVATASKGQLVDA